MARFLIEPGTVEIIRSNRYFFSYENSGPYIYFLESHDFVISNAIGNANGHANGYCYMTWRVLGIFQQGRLRPIQFVPHQNEVYFHWQ